MKSHMECDVNKNSKVYTHPLTPSLKMEGEIVTSEVHSHGPSFLREGLG